MLSVLIFILKKWNEKYGAHGQFAGPLPISASATNSSNQTIVALNVKFLVRLYYAQSYIRHFSGPLQ